MLKITFRGELKYVTLGIQRIAAVIAAALMSTPYAAADETTVTWMGGFWGGWTEPLNWSPAVTPYNNGNTLVNIVVDGLPTQATVLEHDYDIVVNDVRVNAGDALRMYLFSVLHLTGDSLSLDGTLALYEYSNLVLHSDLEVSGNNGILTGISGAYHMVYGEPAGLRLTVGPTIQVRGELDLGMGTLALTNKGWIRASVNGGITVDLDSCGPNYNMGVMSAGPGFMVIRNAVIDNTGGIIRTDSQGDIILSNNTIIGGSIIDSASWDQAEIRNVSQLTLQDVRIDGGFVLGGGSTTRVGGVMNSTNADIKSSTNAAATIELLPGGATFPGSGGIRLPDSTATQIRPQSGTPRLTLGAQFQLSGGGSIGAGNMFLTNHGTIYCGSLSGLHLHLGSTEPNFNDGLIQIGDESHLTLEATALDNASGEVIIGAGSTLTLDSSSIVGGSMHVDGLLSRPRGTMTLTSDRLSGSGEVNAPEIIVASGTVDPGAESSPSYSSIEFVGHTTLSDCTVKIGIAGTQPVVKFDVVAVSGDLQLGGTLHLTFPSGYQPPVGQTYAIITCTGTRSGQFAAVDSDFGFAVVTYGTNGVNVAFQLTNPNPADLTGDGHVDGADLGSLLAAWGPCAGCPADLDGDGAVDGADLGTLLADWG